MPGENFRKTKKGGKNHEKNNSNLAAYVDRVCVGGKNSNFNCTSFTKDGKFIKELRTLAPDMRVKPFGDLFVAARTLMENGIFYVPVNIYDSNLKMIKEIYRVRRGVQVGGNRKQVMDHIKTDPEIKPYNMITP